ncbi:methylcrotonoyl-CoA carboxylase beta chain, mitochondrial isoform X1 [Echeneis naucrates]|uniref:methylcrotonoyl-CoA carboxylase n=2 Tax=Echeneis naucrates TaxID=173247 RepID=A0A665TIP4_ECHNA|nr:methylcrotonoyl-CoA carboxylase beta chain, mitochondrial-like isoform X1 [Echeneis naucrates]XP_029356251.1 methylcrotonoyl-CoA carboxylase beta chain, mitochondrial-like isoform X1 [Echeneis naucrates]
MYRYMTRLAEQRWQCSVRCMSSAVRKGRSLHSVFPVLEQPLQPIHQHVIEANLRNSYACHKKFIEFSEKVRKGGGESGIARHTKRNRKLLVRDRLRLLLDDEDFLELSAFAGLGLPYGDIPSAGCLTGIGRISGLWCVFIANDATVKGGTAYPITVKKQLRAQEVAIQNRLPCVYLVDSGGAFLPLQSEIFPDKNQGGRTFYNEAIMSAMKIPQVSVVCGSCTAGGAYIPTMAEETVMVHRIGTIFLGGPPLVKAATGEEVTPEDLGGARLHAEVSGCVDHFAWEEKEAYTYTRNIISTLNFQLPEEEEENEEKMKKRKAEEEPLYCSEDLMGLAPQSYNYSLDVKMVISRLTDGSRFQEFKARYGTTLVTGFAKIHGHLVGIVANNGKLSYQAALKGSHFVQLCDQRDIPLLFLQNTAPTAPITLSTTQAEMNSNCLKAQGSMLSAVACASVPKITVVIGGCHGADSYAMCGRAFDPNFLFLWPNARVSMTAPGHAGSLLPPDSEQEEEQKKKEQEDKLNRRLKEESSAFFSSARLWDDGVILPQDTRKVLRDCLDIIKQQQYQISTEKQQSALLRM